MISLLVTLIPFIFITYFVITLRKSKFITYELKTGKICYNCKSEIEISPEEEYKNLLDKEKHYTLCKACQRDIKLDSITGKHYHSKLSRFKLWLITNDKGLPWTLIIIMILLLTCDILLKTILHIKWFGYVYNSYLTIYWLLILYRNKLTKIKKPS